MRDWQVEVIREVWAETGNAAHAAREAGCSATAAKRYIAEAREHDELDELRRVKRADVVRQMAEVRVRALEELMSPAKLAAASVKELALLAGIMTDKIQLLSGGATSRSETSLSVGPGALSPEERERARELRAKLLNERGKVGDV